MKCPNTEMLNKAEADLINDLCPNEKAKFDEWFDELKREYLHVIGYIDIRYWYDVFMSGADTDEAATMIKTPCIMKFKDDYLLYFDSMKHVNLTTMEVRASAIESCDTNTTNQYLSNTYGKVESKEHAEFIVELCKVNGIASSRLRIDDTCKFFYIFDGAVFFASKEIDMDVGFKQITIPLPPKEGQEMKNNGDNLVLGCEDSKCVRACYAVKSDEKVEFEVIGGLDGSPSNEYSTVTPVPSEDSKCDEWPKVGDEILTASKSKAKVRGKCDGKLWIEYLNGGKGFNTINAATIQKPKTPEEELRDELVSAMDNSTTASVYAEHMAKYLIEKYNITKKPQ